MFRRLKRLFVLICLLLAALLAALWFRGRREFDRWEIAHANPQIGVESAIRMSCRAGRLTMQYENRPFGVPGEHRRWFRQRYITMGQYSDNRMNAVHDSLGFRWWGWFDNSLNSDTGSMVAARLPVGALIGLLLMPPLYVIGRRVWRRTPRPPNRSLWLIFQPVMVLGVTAFWGGLWIRSHYYEDQLRFPLVADGRKVAIESSNGTLYAIFTDNEYGDREGKCLYTCDAQRKSTKRHEPPGDKRQWLGIGRDRQQTSVQLTGTGGPFWFEVFVPHWLMLLICSPFFLAWVRRRVLVYRWARTCHCVECGYDLRATPEHCPECGTVPRLKAKPAPTDPPPPV